ncbi:sugar ABC transporter substrate-binding protein [Dactylosporangium sp. AC04546]|uniref:ABC transporter substrate-binding protein n=1 Tax=Dactylosporangium sp. AC04546 TaxID=2862460 RepID=UPI001EE05D49|nr:sugar ABC transporter substrate-binding protein [Dactylosporangium sp. AC04546]WVK80947.1 sugar ABC transporter substrate-binding protein [Dactylosporangium sp. AC04546]
MSARPRLRLHRAVALIAVAALALAGCSKGSATKDTSEGGVTTVRYLTFSAAPDHLDDLNSIVAAFEKANPDVKISVQTAPYKDYFTQLQTSIAGGTAPDAFELDYQNFVTYAQAGSLADLAGPAANDKTWQPSVLSPAALDAFKHGGKQYGLPESFSTVVLIYNKALFDAAGVAYPTADWKWSDETAAAQKLTDKAKGIYGDYQPVSFYEFYKSVNQAGGTFLSADGKSATFNSPQGVAAAKWLIGKPGATMPTLTEIGNTPDFDTNLFKAGKLAMWHNGNWQFDTLKSVPFGWDVVVEPGDAQKASAVFQNGVAVSAKSSHQDAAFRWLNFLTTSEQTVTARINSSWELPPLADASKLSGYLDKTPPSNRKAVMDALGKQSLLPVIAKEQQMQDIVNDALTKAAAGADLQKTLDDAAKQVTALL